MKRPLGIVALLYGGGLVLAEFFQPPLPWLFGIALTTAAVALIWAHTRPLLIWPLIVLAGWTNLVGRTTIVSPHDLRESIPSAGENLSVRGRLVETPSERIYVRDDVESFRTLARVAVSSIKRDSTWQPAFGEIIVVTPGILDTNYFFGQEVEIAGILAQPKPPLVEGLFDYRTYLQRQGIYFELKADGGTDWQLLSTNRAAPFSDRFLAWAKATMARGLPETDKPLRLLWAMTLGSKNVLASEVYDPFVESGTMHIFAISGLHIALIAGILVSLLRVLRVSRSWCGAVVIPLIWFYTAATGWQPSAIRSTIMMSVIIAGWSLKRPTDLLNSLATAALIILIWQPQQLFQASFQLSFFVVLSIALLLPPLEKIRERMLRTDPLLPAELVPRWKRWLGWPLRIVSTSLATSLAAWLGSWPLTVYYFHLFSPVTLLANLLVVPLSSLALACNLGSLLCGAWFPGAAELFNFSGWFWMSLMMRISEFAVRLPGAFFFAPSPTLPDFVIYYGVLVATLTGFALAPKRRIVMSLALLAIIGFYLWRWTEARATTEITVLPLNGGSAVYCNNPGTRNDLLIDCGNTNAVEFVIKPFLRAQGMNRLPSLALTHGDLRSVGGTELLESLIPVERIITGPARFRSGKYRELMASLDKTPARRLKLSAGDSLGRWTVLHPASSNLFSRADDGALVWRGEFYGIRILLLSELGRLGQDMLLEGGADLRSDIVVAGLPEQGEPLRSDLLRAIQPQLIVIADSEYPASKRSSAALRERLARTGIPVIYTRTAGAVTFQLRHRRFQMRTAETNSTLIFQQRNYDALTSRLRPATDKVQDATAEDSNSD